MSKKLKAGHFVRFWLPVYFYAVVIFIYSGQSRISLAFPILHGDKLLHLLEYALLAYLLARAARNSLNSSLSKHFRIFAIGAAVLYGISDEFHQHFVPGRHVEALDILADTAGAILGQLFSRG
jgi:VanZ family protein